ncbi:MAG: DUF1735 domain-containing protein [Bacteroidales bacterium]|nr:DUF1735 domain-containing protein [Bacteroidales bacterium]
MKKILSIFAVTLLLAGCFKDDRNNFMVSDSFGISSLENKVETSVHTGKFVLGVTKSGKGQSAAKVRIYRDAEHCQQLIEEYNLEHETSFTPVMTSLFSLDAEEMSFSKKDVVKMLTISWDPSVMSSLLSDDRDYVIPIVIESDDETVKVQEKRRFIMIHLNRSGISVPQTSVARIVEGKKVEEGEELQEVLVLDVNLTPAIKNLAVSFPVCVDNSLIESYNLSHETSFVEAPEGLVTLVDQSAEIKEGAVGGNFRVKLDKSVLMDGDVPAEFPDYLIPVRLQKENVSATLGGEEFQLQGITYGNMVTYISFSYYAPPPGLSIIRVWGKYSTSSAAWNSYFGGEADTDRNFTMDENYIYVPETSQTDANIWRIDIKHPENVSKAAAPATPTGYHKVTAVRMMDPGTTSMNGGKPMLIASNMVMTDGGDKLKLYIYDKGTDTAPAEWIMDETNLGRRLGDIFTTHGTFANGGFLFKDWNKTYGNGTILVWRTAFTSVPNYNQTPRNPTWNTIKDEGGRAAFYPYPGQTTPQKGIYTGTESAYYVTESGNNVYTWNASTFNAEAAGGYYVGAGDFNFFEFQGKRYIAYVKTVSRSDGRFYVLEGELSDDWQDILDSKRKAIFQAAIQDNVQFSDGEYHQELEVESPRESGHSGIGCAVCEIDGEVFMMAGKQNVGLSLFKMSIN